MNNCDSLLKALMNRSVSDSLMLGAGVHDAISGRIAQEVGYDALWVSGLGASAAQHLVPDANIISLGEMAELTRRIISASSVPVLVDADNGYGNVVNVRYAVRLLESAGAAGLCLEDNSFPKRNSFYGGNGRELVDVDEMCGKLEMASATRRREDFVLIARTEALIAGLTPRDAAERAERYSLAGANAVLLHGRSWPLVREACERYRGMAPIVLVPTTYPEVQRADMFAAGARLAIYANQALRAAVTSIRNTLTSLRHATNLEVTEADIASLDEIFRLTGAEDLLAIEAHYGSQAVRARQGSVASAERSDK